MKKKKCFLTFATCRELSFKKGDIIYIRREIDNNWYEGEINATIGLLPANYVEVICFNFHPLTIP